MCSLSLYCAENVPYQKSSKPKLQGKHHSHTFYLETFSNTVTRRKEERKKEKKERKKERKKKREIEKEEKKGVVAVIK
jgi:hypothetical protein